MKIRLSAHTVLMNYPVNFPNAFDVAFLNFCSLCCVFHSGDLQLIAVSHWSKLISCTFLLCCWICCWHRLLEMASSIFISLCRCMSFTYKKLVMKISLLFLTKNRENYCMAPVLPATLACLWVVTLIFNQLHWTSTSDKNIKTTKTIFPTHIWIG